MPLLKKPVGSRSAQVVSESAFTRVLDEDALPAQGDIVVSLARFLREADALTRRAGKLGVALEPADDIAELGPHAGKLALVTVNFPKFGDGRGYSQARLLRERHGYTGELRAIGEVLTDQLFYLARVGFDAFELVESKDVRAALAAFEDFSVTYQAGADESRPLYRRVAR